MLSLWKQYFKPGDGVIIYIDKASRWKGPGNNEFRLYLDSAFKSGQIIRAVIGRTSDEKAVASGVDAHSLDNTFHVREDWIGEVTVWDGNKFEIEFKSK